MIPLGNISQRLLAIPKPDSITDYEMKRRMEITSPNTLNAWSHVIPTLAKYDKCEGRRSILGHDKGKKAYRKMIEKLRLVVLGLYADGLVVQGAESDECLNALVRSLIAFKDVFPNWMDAYLAAYRVFVEREERMLPILREFQRSVEEELFYGSM